MADPNSLEAPAEYIDPAGIRADDEAPREAPAQFARDEQVEQVEQVLAVVKDRGAAFLTQLRAEVQRRPRLFMGLGLGFTLAGLIAGVYGMRNRKPRWRRDLDAYRRALEQGFRFRIHIANEP